MVTATERVIRWSTAGAVVGVAAVAAVASYEHAYVLVRAHGEAGWTGHMVPLTLDGLVYASSMVMLDAARRKTLVPALARRLLGLGIAATLAADVAHGLVGGGGRLAGGRAGRLLRAAHDGGPRFPAATGGVSGSMGIPDPLSGQAVEVFADQLAGDRVPSIRAIRVRLHVGQPRAQRLRDYLATGAVRQAERPAA